MNSKKRYKILKKYFHNNVGIVSCMAFSEIAWGDGPIVDNCCRYFFSLIEITHINGVAIAGFRKAF